MVSLTILLSLEVILKKCPYWGRGIKPKEYQTQLSLVMFILFTLRIYVVHYKNQERFIEQSDLPWHSLSMELPSTGCAMLPAVKFVPTQNTSISKRSPLPFLLPHHKMHKCMKLMFRHTPVVYPLSLFLCKGYHVSRFMGWVVWVCVGVFLSIMLYRINIFNLS